MEEAQQMKIDVKADSRQVIPQIKKFTLREGLRIEIFWHYGLKRWGGSFYYTANHPTFGLTVSHGEVFSIDRLMIPRLLRTKIAEELSPCKRAIKGANLDDVIERSVRDVAAAYESELNRSGLFEKFADKFNDCVKKNSALQKRVWDLENPEPICGSGTCELKL